MKNVGGDKKMLAVPFMTGLKGVVVDEAELIVTLPEGAKSVLISVESVRCPGDDRPC